MEIDLYDHDGNVVARAEVLHPLLFGVERPPETGVNVPQSVSATFRTELTQESRAQFDALCVEQARRARIRSEVEAMDWPDTIGE